MAVLGGCEFGLVFEAHGCGEGGEGGREGGREGGKTNASLIP